MIKLLALLLLVGAASAQYGHSEGPHEDYYTEPHYAFEYSVHDPHTGDIKSQKEERKGDSTHGEYSLVEADGSKRLVQYHVEGKSGFVAEVQKEGGYAKPAYSKPSYYKEEPAPAYYKPAPSYTYKPAPSYSYKPAPSYSYKPAPSYHYEPAPAYKPAPSYHYEPAPAYKPAPSYKPSYDGHGAATSSLSFSTHGAKIDTSTKHIVPPPKHY